MDDSLLAVLCAEPEYLQIIQSGILLFTVYQLLEYHDEIQRNGAFYAAGYVSVLAVEHMASSPFISSGAIDSGSTTVIEYSVAGR